MLRQGWGRASRAWRPMALFSLVLWGCGAVVLTPLATWILHHLATYDDVIVGNYSIHRWLMTPRGVLYLLLGGAGVLFTGILQAAGLFRIADAGATAQLSPWSIVLGLAASANQLIRLSLHAFLLSLAALAVLALGPGLAFLLLLTEHDINYYLTHRPPAWTTAIAISAAWILPLALGLLYLLVRWIYALPAWLDGVRPLPKALRASWEVTAGRSRGLLCIVAGLVASWMLAKTSFDGVLFLTTGFLLKQSVDSVVGVVRVISGFLILSGALSVGLSFLAVAWGSGTWAACYRRDVRGEHTDGQEASTPLIRVPLSMLKGAVRPRVILPTLAALVLGSLGWGAWILNQPVPMTVPLVIAHRAGPADAPENSLAAMRAILDHGAADVVEIDVTLTRDGVLVVAHDKDLMKQAGDPRILRETLFADLADVDIGAGERLARLESFLDLARGKVPLILEFKHGAETNLIERTLQAVREMEMSDEVILMSLELEEVRAVQAQAPDIRVGYFASVEMGDLSQLDVPILGAKESMLDAGFVRDVQSRGIAVYAWTVDDSMRMVELIELGVDGIITNDPSEAARVVDRVAALPPPLRMLLRFRRFWSVLYELGWWTSGGTAG